MILLIRKILNEKSLNVAKTVLKVMVHMIAWFAFFFLLVIIPDEEINVFLSNVAGVMIIFLYMFPFMNRTYINEKVVLPSSFTDIYTWSNNLTGIEAILTDQLKIKKSQSVMFNLKGIKESITNSITSGSIEELRLFKAYLEAYKSSKLEHVYYKTIATSCLTVLIFICRSLIINYNNETNIDMFLQLQYSWGMYVGLFCVLIYFLLIPHRNENRINLINNIIEQCIEEKKDELDKAK